MGVLEWVNSKRTFVFLAKTHQKEPSVGEFFNNQLDKMTLWMSSTSFLTQSGPV